MERIVNENEWIVEMYDTAPDGKEFLTMKGFYTRFVSNVRGRSVVAIRRDRPAGVGTRPSRLAIRSSVAGRARAE